MSDRRSFLSATLRLQGFFDILILLALSGTWLGLLGRLHWTLDLLSHFRWQYLAVCGVAVLWTLLNRRWWVLMVAVASLGLNGWEFYRVRGASHPAVAQGKEKPLRVVSLNVLSSNGNKAGVLDYLRWVDPDIFFLMEVDEAWARELESLRATHPHAEIHPRRDSFGLALLSRVPLSHLQLFQTESSPLPSVLARLSYAGRELEILGTHPIPPMGAAMARMRDDQLRELGVYIAGNPLPILVIGDLNATPWSQGIRALQQGNALAWRSAAPAWMPTWRKGSIFALPIDHALCTPPLAIMSRKIGPDVGSDHRPQELEIGWPAD